jgi:hypothetical protein
VKLRLGFVSNSSSSSFLIYGACITDYISEEGEKIEENNEEYEYDTEELIIDRIHTKIKENHFDIDIDYGYEDKYLGISWSRIGDDETGKQFKDKIKVPTECGTHEECFRNG